MYIRNENIVGWLKKKKQNHFTKELLAVFESKIKFVSNPYVKK